MANPTQDHLAGADAKAGACPYCSKPMDKPVTHKIIDRGWDMLRQQQFVRTRQMQFCSDHCGSNYQMGCEG